MEDDFNTPVAVSVLFDLARELNKSKDNDAERAGQLAASLKQLGGLLGILQDAPEVFLKGKIYPVNAEPAAFDVTGMPVNQAISEQAVDQQIQARLDAKKARNWVLADQIRDDLKQHGVIL